MRGVVTGVLSNRLLLAVLAGLVSLLLWPSLSLTLACALATGGILALLTPVIRLPGHALLAAAWAVVLALQHVTAVPGDMLHRDIEIEGIIVDIPRYGQDVTRFRLRLLAPDALQGLDVQAGWFRPQQQPRGGERWSLTVRLRPPHGSVNRHGFDYAKWLLGNGISATASIRDGRLIMPGASTIPAVRQELADWISATLPPDTAALARALAVGDRGQLGDATRERLAATGTSHLLAISGLHIGLAALFGTLLVRTLFILLLIVPGAPVTGLQQRLPITALAIAGGLIAAVVYALLAGFMLSTQRALLMLLVAVLALLGRRQQLSGRSLLLAAVLILAVNPLQVLNAGFWLSFMAVFSLWLVFAGRGRDEGYGAALLRAQLGLAAVMLAVQAAVIRQISIYMLPVNLLAVPFVSVLVMPALLGALVLQWCDVPFALSLLQFAGRMLAALQSALTQLQTIHNGLYTVAADGTPVLLLAGLGSLWLVLPRGVPYRWLGPVLWLPLLWPVIDRPAEGEWLAEVFDVGQGTAVAVRTRNHVLLYDTGPGDNAGRDFVRSAMLPLLSHWRQPVKRVIISHGDLDHAGGLHSVRRHWPAAVVAGSMPGADQRPCIQGQGWHWDGVDFEILHPGGYLPYLKNDSSCVLLVSSPAGRLLLPGDISQAVEQRLLYEYGGPPADVLLAPHHGSAYSSGPAWLAAVAPAVAIVTAGQWNRYDFPKPEVERRYDRLGIGLYNTAACGGVRLRARSDTGITVTARRQQLRRWWRGLVPASCATGQPVPLR